METKQKPRICEICNLRSADKIIPKQELEIFDIHTDDEIWVCRKCLYTWTSEDINIILSARKNSIR